MRNLMKMGSARIKSFSQNLSGAVSVEAIIMLPILLWVVAAMAVFLDVFRTKSAMDKAAFTISDALSRETNAITDTYLTNSRTLFEELSSIDENSSSLRVSVISWDINTDAYALDWSQVRGQGFLPLLDADLPYVEQHLPEIAMNETLILVETHYTYEPLYDIGPIMSGRGNEEAAWDLDMGTSNMQTFVFTRPRYASQLIYSNS